MPVDVLEACGGNVFFIAQNVSFEKKMVHGHNVFTKPDAYSAV